MPFDHDVSTWEDSTKGVARKVFGDKVNVFTILYSGMGCYFFCRKLADNNVELFFMHSDNWGQYGLETSDVPKLKEFIRGYELVE
jgi:hypothetical protein